MRAFYYTCMALVVGASMVVLATTIHKSNPPLWQCFLLALALALADLVFFFMLRFLLFP